MTKQEALNKIEELKKFIEKEDQKPSKEEMFWELILKTNSIKIDKSKYPNLIFGFKDDKFLWKYDSENRYLWLSYIKIWAILEKEYNLSYSETQAFIKSEVEEHFKCKGITP